MRVAAVYNPGSGKGRAKALAEHYASHLRARGLTVDLCHTHESPSTRDSKPFASIAPDLSPADTVLVSGGDGTVHRLLPAILASGAALCQLPAGTENLFGREFGFPRSPSALARAIEHRRRIVCDVGNLAGIPFALMASTGPDAGIIRRLDALRRGPISHLSYLRPILAEWLRPSLPLLTIHAQGQRWVTRQRGMLVVANTRQYAWRLDPCRRASPTDRQLDAVFLGGDSAPDMVRWALSYLAVQPGNYPSGVITRRAAEFTVLCHSGDDPAPWQADGEFVAPALSDPRAATTISIDRTPLSILAC